MPQIGEPEFDPGTKEEPRLRLPVGLSRTTTKSASAGYYKVKLQKYERHRRTDRRRARRACMRITFPESDQASILTDLSHVLPASVESRSGRTSASRTTRHGHRFSSGPRLGPGALSLFRRALLAAVRQLSRSSATASPVVYRQLQDAIRFRSRAEAAGANLRFLAEYKTKKDEVILVKVAVSAVSAANALKNLDAEIPDWDFDSVRRETRAEMGPRTEQDPDRRHAGGEGDLLHRDVSLPSPRRTSTKT